MVGSVLDGPLRASRAACWPLQKAGAGSCRACERGGRPPGAQVRATGCIDPARAACASIEKDGRDARL